MGGLGRVEGARCPDCGVGHHTLAACIPVKNENPLAYKWMTNWKSAERGATEGWNRARTAEARVEELEELLRTAPIDMDMRLGTVAWTKRRDAALAKKGE